MMAEIMDGIICIAAETQLILSGKSGQDIPDESRVELESTKKNMPILTFFYIFIDTVCKNYAIE